MSILGILFGEKKYNSLEVNEYKNVYNNRMMGNK
jgi:hypothetical protein